MSPVTPSWAIKAFGNILSQKGEKKKGKEKNKRQHELKKKKKRTTRDLQAEFKCNQQGRTC